MSWKDFLQPSAPKLILALLLFLAFVPVFEVGSAFPCSTTYCPRISRQASALEMAGYFGATDTYISFAPSLLSLAGLLASYLLSCLAAALCIQFFGKHD